MTTTDNHSMCREGECPECTPELHHTVLTGGVPRRTPGPAPVYVPETPKAEKALTGGSSGYYKVQVTKPTTPYKIPYEAECNDIIEALDMRFAEGNVFKAIWRRAAARLDNGKPGTDSKYDAEKMVFFSDRELAKEE